MKLDARWVLAGRSGAQCVGWWCCRFVGRVEVNVKLDWRIQLEVFGKLALPGDALSSRGAVTSVGTCEGGR